MPYANIEKLQKVEIFQEIFTSLSFPANSNSTRFTAQAGYYYRFEVDNNNLSATTSLSYKIKRSSGEQIILYSNYEGASINDDFTLLAGDKITVSTLGSASTLDGTITMLLKQYKTF